MHQQIQQRREVLDALRTRSIMAAAELHRMTGTEPQPSEARFKVQPVSAGLFRITDTNTGKVKGWKRSHGAACGFAQALERQVGAEPIPT